MKRLLLSVIVSLLVCTDAVFAQKEYNNWILSESWMCGLSFNTPSGDAYKMNDYLLYDYDTASISDSSGCLLFYFHDGQARSRYGELMKNGYFTSWQGFDNQNINVPQPGNNCNYYIFSTDGDSNNSLVYSIADLSLGDGFGEITKNIVPLLNSKSHCVAAVGQEPGENVWISTIDNNTFTLNTFLLTEDSLFKTPVTTPFKNRYRISQFDRIKFSPDGKRLAWIFFLDSMLILFDFDDQTGKFSNEIAVKMNDRNPRYLEFSENSKLLYIISRKIYAAPVGQIKYLYQYDISLNNPIDIENSRYQVYETKKIYYYEDLYGLQIGPNNRIYTSHSMSDAFGPDTTNIIIIDKPNLQGNNCNLIINDSNPLGGIIYDFPHKVQNYYPKKKLCTYHNITVCEGEPIQLLSPFFPDAKYEWSGPKQIKIPPMQNPFLEGLSPENSGYYYFRISQNGILQKIDSINVTIHPKEKILVKGMSMISLCKDTVLQFLAVENPDGCIIRWKKGNYIISKENLVTISTSGTYTVVVENKYGCIDSATIEIRLKKPVKLSIIGNQYICIGDEISLSANDEYSEYLWSTGDTSASIIINKGGLYTLKVKNDNGCEGIDSITIVEYEKPKVEFEKSTYALCFGDSLLLKPIDKNPDYEYIWSDGYNGIERIIKANISLSLIAKSKNGCADTAYAIIGFYDVPEAAIIADKTEACFGEQIKLTAINYDQYLHYIWSNGQKGESIVVTESGIYTLIVKVGTFCSDTTEIEVKFHPPLNLKLLSENHDPCSSDSVKLYTDLKYDQYLWSTGETTDFIIARQTGTYWVKVKNSIGCSDSASIDLQIQNLPIPIIITDKTEACFGEKIILSAEYYNPEFSYLWSTGETTESITVTESGIYKLLVTNDNQCKDSTDIEVKIYDDLALQILADKTNLCFDDSTKIYPANTYSDYSWSTGDTKPYITVKEAGIYQLIAKNEYGCVDTSEIEIFKFDADIEINKGDIIFDELCVGETEIENLQFTIKSSSDLTISSISTTSNSYEIVNYNSLLKSYKNGEVVNLEIIFKPQDAGNFDDELVISSTEPCEFVRIIQISASAKQVIEFSLGEHYSEAGQILEIPLLGQIKCPEPQNLTTDYEIEVLFDKAYFYPGGVKFGQIISNEIIGNERVIKIKADGDFRQAISEINVIYGKALLGRSESSQIKIEDGKFTKDLYFPEYVNGSLNVDGCLNDITTFKMFTPTKMSVSPNPTDGELNISIGTQEQGSFSLIVFDVQGIEVFRSEFTRNDRTFEQKDYNLNTQNLGNGIYTIHLTAPWTMLREQVVVVR